MRAPDFWTQSSGALSKLLSPFGWIYAKIGERRLKNGTAYKAPYPVICIGNLTAGGTGKTPSAVAIAEGLISRGAYPNFLTRGYGGKLAGPLAVDIHKHNHKQIGDEALLLGAIATTWLSRNRAEGARLAISDPPDVLIMDDGFQNPSLHKDLSIIVIDAAVGFGNGRIIPAGPLREHISSGLSRADVVILVGEGDNPLPGDFTKPVLRAHLKPRSTGLSLEGTEIIAFAGIGRPKKFFDMLRKMGALIKAEHAFPDHHSFNPMILKRLKKDAEDIGAMLVTTEKDAARLPHSFRQSIMTVMVALDFEDKAEFEKLLDRIEQL